jgi:hypothetical protein
MYIGVYVKYPLFLSYVNEIWVLSTDFREILKYKISRKSVQLKLSRADGRKDRQTDTMRLTVAFFNFVGNEVNFLPTPWRHMEGAEAYLHSFLIWTLDGSEWSASRPGRFTPGKGRRYVLIGKLVGPRSHYWRFGKEKYFLSLLAIKLPIVQSAA